MMYRLRYIMQRSFSISTIKYESQTIGPKTKQLRPEQKAIRKSISVAIIGGANAGKSTLINAMMGLNICAASKRPHTTQEYQRVFNVQGDTQIILLDTPGILSLRGRAKFQLKNSADVFFITPIKAADLVGVLVDVSCKYSCSGLDSQINRLISSFPSRTELVLLLNKIDLWKDKFKLLELVDKFSKLSFNCEGSKESKKFSRIFMISALQNDGVQAFVEYICCVAPETSEKMCEQRLSDHPDAKIVEQRVKAALLEHFKLEVPYKCQCEVEFMQENVSGEMHIVVLLKCPRTRYQKILNNYILMNKVRVECERDFKQLFGKTIYLRLEAVLGKKK